MHTCVAINRYQVQLRANDNLYGGAVSAFIGAVNRAPLRTSSTGHRESISQIPVGRPIPEQFAPQGIELPADDDPEAELPPVFARIPEWDWEVWDRENPEPWDPPIVEAAEYEVIPPTLEPQARVFEPPIEAIEPVEVSEDQPNVVTNIPIPPSDEDMAIDWGDAIGGAIAGGLGFFDNVGNTGAVGTAPVAAPPPAAGPPAYSGSCPPRKTRTLTIDCATGREVKRTRRRRRRLLTEGDFNDLMRIATLPNKQNVTVALAKAVGRR